MVSLRHTASISLALVLQVLAAPSALAQEGWSPACGDRLCTLSRAAADATSGQRVGTFLVVVEGDGALSTGAVVPLGAAVEPGLQLVQGETRIGIPFQVCFPDGCRALAPVEEPALIALAGQSPLEIRFFIFGAEQLIAVPVPLDGLAEAIAEARATLAAAPPPEPAPAEPAPGEDAGAQDGAEPDPDAATQP